MAEKKREKDLCVGFNVSMPKSTINWLRQLGHDSGKGVAYHVNAALAAYRRSQLKTSKKKTKAADGKSLL